ncbi:MAG: SDR family NAD(P)-dependent oxidoreductase [Micrococcales bacterium]|nr:SDR family NAD(P)-dependent oxidoreductase [Micrococcales bacterium]OJX66794.1 MAG: alcohol dehydrogenase [Micrococcales bacterium 72-143]
MDWNPQRLPDQTGRTIVVTGSTAGIGYFAAEQLAGAGAEVVLAGRSAARIDAAAHAIRARHPRAGLASVIVDLASLDSVARAAETLARRDRVDGLLLNGGAMARWTSRTDDGLPLTLATHVVANVGLIVPLLPALARSGTPERASRIVHVSSGFVDRAPRLALREPLRTPRLGVRAYTHAKALTELLAFELDARLRENGLPISSLVSRPGVGVDARTPERAGVHDATTPHRRNPYTPWAQGKDAAAWSAVRALTDPAARGGELYAPVGGIAGPPVRVEPPAHTARPEAEVAAESWARIAELARVDDPLTPASGALSGD